MVHYNINFNMQERIFYYRLNFFLLFGSVRSRNFDIQGEIKIINRILAEIIKFNFAFQHNTYLIFTICISRILLEMYNSCCE